MKTQIHDALPRTYEFEVLDEIPSPNSLPFLYYPGATTAGGKDGTIIKVYSNKGAEWIGMFAGDRERSAIYTCPKSDDICVVSLGGAGYFVDSNRPSIWSRVPVHFVTEAFQVPKLGLLVMHDCLKILALGPKGIVWQAELGEELEITDQDETTLTGTSSENRRPLKFKIHLKDGGIEYLD